MTGLRFLRAAVAGLLLPFVMSCGEASDELDLLRGTLNPDAPRYHPRANDLATVRPIPPRLEVSFPSRDLTGVMLLEAERNGIQTWLTADGATINLRDGLLIAAKGFGTGLTGSDIHEVASVLRADRTGVAERVHSFLNGNDEIELRAYKCEIAPVGQEDIFVQGLAVTTIKIVEQCFGVAQQFENTYWMHPKTGRILQSSQWTGDFLGNLFMKVVPE